MDADELTARLAEVEARFTLQQDVIDKLSEVVWALQRELDAMGVRLKAVEAKRTAGAETDDVVDEPPPHY